MIIGLVGPTAVGKTSQSIELALEFGGPDVVEVVGADAMQLYRGLDIGTAKITEAERRNIVHHQIDVLDIHEEASVAAYQYHARRDIEDIKRRGKVPFLVGGSGLYVNAVLDEIEFPGTIPAVRAKYEALLQEIGAKSLHDHLREVDPASADVIDPRNIRRVVRALEVNEVTGRSFQPRFPRHTCHYPNLVLIGFYRAADELEDRIKRRTVAMFERGLIEETSALRKQGLDEAPTAATATGYAQARAVLDGDISVQEAIAQVALATRRLVKKQMTWFRRDPRITWVDAGKKHNIMNLIGKVES